MNATRPLPRVLAVLFAVPLFLGAPAPSRAGSEPTPPDVLEAWMPPECAGYLKFQGLGHGLDSFLESEALKDLEALPVVQFLLAQEPWQKFKEGLAEFRTNGGKDPLQVFRDLLGQEVVIALSPQDGGVLLLTRAAGEKELEGALQALRQAIGKKMGINLEGYRTAHGERSIETIGEASFVSVGRVFAMGNRMPSLERFIDLAEGKAKGSLKDGPLFAKASRSAGKGALVSLAMRPREIPNFYVPGKLDNPLGSLILGGLMGALEGSEAVTGALRFAEGSVDVEFSSFSKEAKADEKYRAFFPATATAPGPLADRLGSKSLLALSEIHRDLKKWFDQRDELLDPHAAGDLGNFNQIMSIIFGGRSFQDEILPQIGSTITLLARNQEYKDLPDRPKPAIPGFAGLFELKEAKDLPATMVSAFQTMIGILNSEHAKKEPGAGAAFVLRTEKVGDVEVQVAAANLPKDSKPEIAANFSPSLAVVGSRLVIASSAELARSLVEELKGLKAPAAAPAAGRAPDMLRIDSAPVASIIRENLGFIIEDNVRKKGISTEQATSEMNALLDLLSRLRDFSLETTRDGDQVLMKMKLRHSLGGSGAVGKSEEKKTVSF